MGLRKVEGKKAESKDYGKYWDSSKKKIPVFYKVISMS